MRSNKWMIDEYNRNRHPDDHITTIEELEEKRSEMEWNTTKKKKLTGDL